MLVAYFVKYFFQQKVKMWGDVGYIRGGDSHDTLS